MTAWHSGPTSLYLPLGLDLFQAAPEGRSGVARGKRGCLWGTLRLLLLLALLETFFVISKGCLLAFLVFFLAIFTDLDFGEHGVLSGGENL
jgi:hypothetical protein